MKHVLLTTTLALTLLPLGVMAQNAPPPRMPPGPPHMSMFAHADLDNDGKISKSEARNHRGKMFDRMDTDGDGYLSDDEKRLSRRKHHFGRRMHHAQNRIMHRQALDTDKDGNISQAEFMAGPSPLFDRMDSNKDGAISAEELVTAQEPMFTRFDANKDGVITREEMMAGRPHHAPFGPPPPPH